MQQQAAIQTKRRLFTASEVAQFEYCSLVWWHEQYGPLAHMDTEDLFARLVELEHEYGQQAVALPEYETIEQLLLRQGAFDEGRRQHEAHADEVAEIEKEAKAGARKGAASRVLIILIVLFVVLAFFLIAAAVLAR